MFRSESEFQKTLNIFRKFSKPSKATPNLQIYPNFDGSGIEEGVIKELGASKPALKLLSRMLEINPKQDSLLKKR